MTFHVDGEVIVTVANVRVVGGAPGVDELKVCVQLSDSKNLPV